MAAVDLAPDGQGAADPAAAATALELDLPLSTVTFSVPTTQPWRPLESVPTPTQQDGASLQAIAASKAGRTRRDIPRHSSDFS